MESKTSNTQEKVSPVNKQSFLQELKVEDQPVSQIKSKVGQFSSMFNAQMANMFKGDDAVDKCKTIDNFQKAKGPSNDVCFKSLTMPRLHSTKSKAPMPPTRITPKRAQEVRKPFFIPEEDFSTFLAKQKSQLNAVPLDEMVIVEEVIYSPTANTFVKKIETVPLSQTNSIQRINSMTKECEALNTTEVGEFEDSLRNKSTKDKENSLFKNLYNEPNRIKTLMPSISTWLWGKKQNVNKITDEFHQDEIVQEERTFAIERWIEEGRNELENKQSTKKLELVPRETNIKNSNEGLACKDGESDISSIYQFTKEELSSLPPADEDFKLENLLQSVNSPQKMEYYTLAFKESDTGSPAIQSLASSSSLIDQDFEWQSLGTPLKTSEENILEQSNSTLDAILITDSTIQQNVEAKLNNINENSQQNANNFSSSSSIKSQERHSVSAIDINGKTDERIFANAVTSTLPSENISKLWIKCGDISLALDIDYVDPVTLRLLHKNFAEKSCHAKDLHIGIDGHKFSMNDPLDMQLLSCPTSSDRNSSHFWFSTGGLTIPFTGKYVLPRQIRKLFHLIKEIREDSAILAFGVDELEFANMAEFWQHSANSECSTLEGQKTGDVMPNLDKSDNEIEILDNCEFDSSTHSGSDKLNIAHNNVSSFGQYEHQTFDQFFNSQPDRVTEMIAREESRLTLMQQAILNFNKSTMDTLDNNEGDNNEGDNNEGDTNYIEKLKSIVSNIRNIDYCGNFSSATSYLKRNATTLFCSCIKPAENC